MSAGGGAATGVWFAAAPDSPKVRQIRENPMVDIQYQVAAPEYTHIMVRGRAGPITDQETRNRVWDVIDYDLTAFGLSGPEDPEFIMLKLLPEWAKGFYKEGPFGFEL